MVSTSLMMQNVIAFAYVIIGAVFAPWFHMRIFAAHGARRLGRLVAYLGGAFLGWAGLLLTLARVNGGWHTLKGMSYEIHISVAEGLNIALGLALISGLACFAKSEMNGGQTFAELTMPEAVWAQYIRRILGIESMASAVDRRRTAKFLLRSAPWSRQDLPPELSAYVKRNAPEPGSTQ
jgi:hypothetical protein